MSILKARLVLQRINHIKYTYNKGTVSSQKLLLKRDIASSNITVVNPSEFKKLNVRDTNIFQQKQMSKLFFQYAILKSCSFPLLTTVGPAVLDVLEKIHLSAPAYFILKHTFYKYFVAGEDINHCIKAIDELGSYGISSILDYSVESITGSVDEIVETLIETIRLAKVNKNTEFSCFKMTALASTHLLGRMNILIERNGIHNIPWANIPKFDSFSQLVEHVLPIMLNNHDPEYLHEYELNELRQLASRLEKLADASIHYNVSVLVDAEQSYYQKAIHFLVLLMARQYNTSRPVFYETYQMYTKSSLDTLINDVQYAEDNGFVLGIKIVRGAYMVSERERATLHGYASPIHDTIEDTHSSYDNAIKFMLGMIHKGSEAGLLIASHNENSIVYATEIMSELGLESNHKKIHFAQLYGMRDHISLSLSQSNYNICKYVPFGPIKEVIPYLIRRLMENKDVIGKSSAETDLIASEFKRRFNKLFDTQTEIGMRTYQS